MLKISYLSDYINIVVYKSDAPFSLAEFASSVNAFSKNILCENEDIKAGDYLIVDFKRDNIHIVKPAETLRSIAEKHKIPYETLKAKNKCERVFVGQQIYL